MLDMGKKHKADSRCTVAHGTMGHLDVTQPPTRRKPYSAVLGLPFVHKVELFLPQEVCEDMRSRLEAVLPVPRYSRVILPLSAILEGEFFTNYVKKGDIIMLSEGQHGVDNTFSLRAGMLSLNLDKASYERAGLVGKPAGNLGRRGGRSRWVVEINLRLPSMLHGKKGFDRILYACKTVFCSPLTWLFADLFSKSFQPDLLASHFPIVTECPPSLRGTISTITPLLQPPLGPLGQGEEAFQDFAIDLLEWISLISLESPRVAVEDNIDPFLSRYAQPQQRVPGEQSTISSCKWTGFFPADFAHNVLVQALSLAPPSSWFVCSIFGFRDVGATDRQDVTILKIPGPVNEFVLWQVEQTN